MSLYKKPGKASEAHLKDRDFTLIIDKSGSMRTSDTPSGQRWKYAQESTVAIAHKMAEFDPDGLTLYMFNSSFKRHDNVKPEAVENVWKEHEPNGSTNLAAVLKDALDNYFDRKAKGTAQANGEIITVVTDGVPDSQEEVARIIVAATKKMDRDEELGILFLQIGKDQQASEFLRKLDDDLEKEGAKFDIVDAKTIDDIGNMTLSDVLLGAIND